MIRWLQRRRRAEIRRRPFPAAWREIVAQARTLLLHRETDYFSKLVLILACPSAYVASTSSCATRSSSTAALVVA